MDDLISILLSPHGNRMTGLLTGAYNIEAASNCVCVEEGRELYIGHNNNNNNSISLPSYFNLQDDDLLAAGGSETEVEPDLLDIGLLDTSGESMGSKTEPASSWSSPR